MLEYLKSLFLKPYIQITFFDSLVIAVLFLGVIFIIYLILKFIDYLIYKSKHR